VKETRAMTGSRSGIDPAASDHRDPLLLVRLAQFPFAILDPLAGPELSHTIRTFLDAEREVDGEAASLSEELYAIAGAPSRENAAERGAVLALRRAIFNRRSPSPSEWAAASRRLPAPLADRLDRHLQRIRAQRDAWPALEEAYRAERARAQMALIAHLGDGIFDEALRLVSRSLHAKAHALAAAPPARWAHREWHVAAKVLAYLGRAATKTSPHGVFCATSLGRWTAGTVSVEGTNEIARVDLLLNVGEARKIAACLAADPALDAAIMPRLNPTLRETDGGWTFWRPASSRRETDEEVFSRAKDHPVLRMFLEAARAGTHSALDLVRAVGAQCGADVRGFYEQLVQRGVLIAEIEIPHASRRPLLDIATACRAAGCTPPWLDEVERVEADVEALPSLPRAERFQRMDDIERRLAALPHARQIASDELFRLDAAAGLTVSLPRSILPELERALEWYGRLAAAMYPERLLRASYAARFLEKFPADADVEILDLYHGVFEPGDERRPAAFIEPAAVAGRPVQPVAEATERFRRARDFFARTAREAASAGRVAVDLAEAGWADVVDGAPVPRLSAGVLFQVAAQSAGAIERGEYAICLNGFFPGAGLSVARLAHLHANGAALEVNPIVREIRGGWAWMERPGTVIAEITYMHSGRTANAGLRPRVFRHEIELPGDKASPGAEVIPLSDLVVRYDAREEKFILRSKSRGVEVLPIISSGINPEGFISFLVLIGQQDLQPVGYFPGFDVDGVTHWPRYTLGRIVLFRRRWVVPAPTLPAEGAGGGARFFLEATRWRKEHQLPRRVFVHSDVEPKPVYVDLESTPFVDLLRRMLTVEGERRPRTLHVTEMLPAPDEMWVGDARGRYASEFLVHMRNVNRA
jgi:hypothetical protein